MTEPKIARTSSRKKKGEGVDVTALVGKAKTRLDDLSRVIENQQEAIKAQQSLIERITLGLQKSLAAGAVLAAVAYDAGIITIEQAQKWSGLSDVEVVKVAQQIKSGEIKL